MAAAANGQKPTRRRALVKWYNSVKGYGFLTDHASGQDVFFHSSAVVEERDLRPDEFVTYIEGNERGRPCARQVMRLGHARPA
jgi:cold shock CspA family protein